MALSTGAPYRAYLRRCSLYSGFIATSVANADKDLLTTLEEWTKDLDF